MTAWRITFPGWRATRSSSTRSSGQWAGRLRRACQHPQSDGNTRVLCSLLADFADDSASAHQFGQHRGIGVAQLADSFPLARVALSLVTLDLNALALIISHEGHGLLLMGWHSARSGLARVGGLGAAKGQAQDQCRG